MMYRHLFLVLCVLLGFNTPALLRAEEQGLVSVDIDAEPGPGPLFNPFEVNPVHFAMQGFAASSLPTAGHGVLGVIYAGEHDSVMAWQLEGVLSSRESRIAAGAATVLLKGFSANPYSTLATLRGAETFHCWTLRDTDTFYRLPDDWLALVRDNRPIPVGDLEAEIYAKVITQANYTSDKAFRKHARREVNPINLHAEPALYRGEVVFLEGHLRLINRFQPPPEAMAEGVNDLYEAWIFPDTLGAKAVCVVFTEWPAGLSRSLLGQRKTDRIRVQVAGYFFKLITYDTKDKNQPEKVAPLLIAHTLTLPGARMDETAGGAAWLRPIIYLVPCLLLGMIVLVVGITYYLRRQDQKLRDHLRRVRDKEFVPPPPDEVPVALPVAAPIRSGQVTKAAPTARFNLPGRSDPPSDGSIREGSSESGGKPPDDQTGA
jgi:hypothetical protein